MVKRSKDKWRYLSGEKVCIVLVIDFLIYLGFFCFFYFLERGSIGNIVKGEFGLREIVLCLVFSTIITTIINYYYIIKPLWDMEEMFIEFQRETISNDFKKDMSLGEILKVCINQQKNLLERKKLEDKQRKKTEIYALQAQINPHFLYNALDSIRGYALLNDVDEIADITESLSRIFRNMISDKSEMITLRREMANIKDYMRIQQFRFNNKFEYIDEISDEIKDNYIVPRMILQPLVENAIMHGLERKVEGGWVKISASITEKRFIVRVIDNGVGISEERLDILNKIMRDELINNRKDTQDNHAGIALININHRLKLTYGSKYGIVLTSTPGIRTTTEVILPLRLDIK